MVDTWRALGQGCVAALELTVGRFVATPAVAKHRLFAWLDSRRCYPIIALFVFTRDDDYFFGVLHSRAHELWALEHILHSLR